MNKFFMCFVSEIVFEGDSDGPDEEIIRWLLDCITCRGAGGAATTRQFSLFNSADVVDPTPVLRSFLLKLLLQCTQSDTVHDQLNQILDSWTASHQQYIQTMVLFMDCWKVRNTVIVNY